MPDHLVHLSDADRDTLDRVRQQQGLESIAQTVEWLAKTRLRRTARASNGRGRSLYPVSPSKEPRP
jgi:hypothetical protein